MRLGTTARTTQGYLGWTVRQISQARSRVK
jgi:hypothetical protein